MGFPHPATAPPYRGPQPWSTGLCDCTDDCGNCKLLAMLLYRCMTCFCPCVTFGRIAEIVDQGSTCKPSSSPTVSIQPNRCQHRLMGVFRWSAACGTSGVLYGVLEYLTCFHWVYSCCYRSKLRAQYSLPESPCADCLVHCCCESCALCQEYRELKHRDFDMTIVHPSTSTQRHRSPTLRGDIEPLAHPHHGISKSHSTNEDANGYDMGQRFAFALVSRIGNTTILVTFLSSNTTDIGTYRGLLIDVVPTSQEYL
ncbi:hypothetical protein GW17_00054334 [Ensete ventricosum]|nr:hypothetical protein GW17_00054334 [Ensete ventricosum]